MLCQKTWSEEENNSVLPPHSSMKINHCAVVWLLPENERIITDVLRQIVLETSLHIGKRKYPLMFLTSMAKKGSHYLACGHSPWWNVKRSVIGLLGTEISSTMLITILHMEPISRFITKFFVSPEEIDEQAIVQLLKEAVESISCIGKRFCSKYIP